MTADAASPPKRTRVVAVRLNDAEFAAWEAATLASHRRQVGAWVRDEAVAVYLRATKNVRRTPSPATPDADPAVDGEGDAGAAAQQVAELAALRGELSRVGNNINQIAAVLNQPSHPAHEAARADAGRVIGEVGPQLGRVYELLSELAARR